MDELTPEQAERIKRDAAAIVDVTLAVNTYVETYGVADLVSLLGTILTERQHDDGNDEELIGMWQDVADLMYTTSDDEDIRKLDNRYGF